MVYFQVKFLFCTGRSCIDFQQHLTGGNMIQPILHFVLNGNSTEELSLLYVALPKYWFWDLKYTLIPISVVCILDLYSLNPEFPNSGWIKQDLNSKKYLLMGKINMVTSASLFRFIQCIVKDWLCPINQVISDSLI